MWFLILKTGIFVLFITSVVGRAVSEEANEEISIRHFEESSTKNCICESKYYKHYEVKGCIVEEVDSCGCPKKYFCPQHNRTNEEQKACFYQTHEYKVGSRVNITDRCQSCRCLGDPPQITCRSKECPQLEHAEGQNCHLVYAKDQCCPSKYECVSEVYKNEANAEGSFCKYNGVTYPLGSKIYPHDDPCLICECTVDWEGISNSSCYQQDCLFEKHKHLMERGCVPVYHENKCCPIEFFCPENFHLNNFSLEDNGIVKNVGNIGHKCEFAGQFYELGVDIPIDNPCIKCICLIPPDLTCTHKSCPPVTDLEFCEVVYSSNDCCPSYECVSNDNDNNNGSKIVCPTPLCADSTCQIKIPEGHQCPTCICDESESHEKNIFEPSGEGIMEGPLQNTSLSSINDPEDDSEGLDVEVMIPIGSEFNWQNQNTSENLVGKDHSEFDFVEDLDHEVDVSSDIFEKESETFQIDSESQDAKSDSIDIERSHGSNVSQSGKVSIKILRKRSTDFRNDEDLNQAQQNGIQSDQFMENQQQFFVEEEGESHHETSDGSDEDYDEINLSSINKSKEIVGNRGSALGEDLDSSESVIDANHQPKFKLVLRETCKGNDWNEVPAGCPTPLCANSSCKIEIPIGHRCPTCVCKRRETWQP